MEINRWTHQIWNRWRWRVWTAFQRGASERESLCFIWNHFSSRHYLV